VKALDKTNNSRDCNAADGASATSRLIPFDRWLRDIGKSRATGWRWRCNGVVSTCNVFGRRYITREEIARFERAALDGELAREIGQPLRQP
jgi:hypothetical protein